MKKLFLFLLTFTPSFLYVSTVSVAAAAASEPLEIQDFSKQLPPVRNPEETPVLPTEGGGDVEPVQSVEAEPYIPEPIPLTREAVKESPTPVASEPSDDDTSPEPYTADTANDFVIEDTDTVANNNSVTDNQQIADASESDTSASDNPVPDNSAGTNEPIAQSSESSPSTYPAPPNATPVAQIATPVADRRPIAAPGPQNYGSLGIQLPQEVVAIAEQQNYDILRGIPTAITANPVSNPDISPEKRDLLDAGQDKQVYKVELEDLSFLCGEDGETPATVAKVKGQDELIVVLWDSEFFEKAGYDPQTRCKQASTRFADFAEKNVSAYLTSGELNNQPVICLTSSEDGGCGEGITLHEGLLFTLKPNDDPEEKLEQLASLLEPKAIKETEDSTDLAKKAPESRDPLEE